MLLFLKCSQMFLFTRTTSWKDWWPVRTNKPWIIFSREKQRNIFIGCDLKFQWAKGILKKHKIQSTCLSTSDRPWCSQSSRPRQYTAGRPWESWPGSCYKLLLSSVWNGSKIREISNLMRPNGNWHQMKIWNPQNILHSGKSFCYLELLTLCCVTHPHSGKF